MDVHRSFLSFLAAAGFLSLVLLRSDGFTPSSGTELQADHHQKISSETIAREDLGPDYDKWLNEDVGYIITKEERKTFARLTTNEERVQFIESFWQRRNPNPDSVMNEFKDEHYRRIAYANEHFGTSVPGWKTDRGHVYIVYGHPDEIEVHRDPLKRLPEEGEGDALAFERWRYRYLESMGTDVSFEFVDQDGSGNYHLALEPSEKQKIFSRGDWAPEDRLLRPTVRFKTPDGGVIELFIGITSHAPQVKFMDLNEIVTAQIVRHQVQFTARTDYLRATSFTDLVPISIEVPVEQLTLQDLGGNRSAHLRILLRITTLVGRTVATIEDTISQNIPESGSAAALRAPIRYERTIPLQPYHYKVAVVIEDSVSGNIGTVTTDFAVRAFEDGELTASSLVLGEPTEIQLDKQKWVWRFDLTSRGLSPRASAEFFNGEQLGIYLQLYNLKVDDRINHPNISINYRITKDGKSFLEQPELPDPATLGGERLTLRRSFPLASFPPGRYQVEVDVNDGIARRRISRTADFVILPAPTNKIAP